MKYIKTIAVLLALSLIFLVYYGHVTQCDGVAVYVKCHNFWKE